MPDIQITRHGQARMQQRGYRQADITLALALATQIDEDQFMLTHEDASREIARRKQEIQQLERLRGTRLVVVGGRLVTLYQTKSVRQTRRNNRGN